MDARSTLEQLLAPYPNPESHNAQRHRQTDGQQDDANSRSYCVAVRSAKNKERRKFHIDQGPFATVLSYTALLASDG